MWHFAHRDALESMGKGRTAIHLRGRSRLCITLTWNAAEERASVPDGMNGDEVRMFFGVVPVSIMLLTST